MRYNKGLIPLHVEVVSDFQFYMIFYSLPMQLGPLHTQAKSRDHEIERAQKKVSEGRPRHLQNHAVVTDPQV